MAAKVTAQVTYIDLGMDRITRNMRMIDKSFTLVGFPGERGIPQNITERAAINEYGTRNGKIPARPFMRQTQENAQVQEKLVSLRAKLLNQIYDGTIVVWEGLNKIGEWYVGEIKKMFTRGDFVENAPSTIAKKKSSRPLIDTGEMRNSVTFKTVVIR